MNPMQKQAKVGRMNSGKQRRMGRRTRMLLTAEPSGFFFFFFNKITLSYSNPLPREAITKTGRAKSPPCRESISADAAEDQPLTVAYSMAQPSTKAVTTPSQLASD